MKKYLMMFMLMIVVTVPVVLAGGDDPNEPTEFRMLADDEGGTDEPTE